MKLSFNKNHQLGHRHMAATRRNGVHTNGWDSAPEGSTPLVYHPLRIQVGIPTFVILRRYGLRLGCS